MYAGVVLFRKTWSVLLRIWSLPGSVIRELRSLFVVFLFGWPPQEPLGRRPGAAPADNGAAGGVGAFLASGGQPAAGDAHQPELHQQQQQPDIVEVQQQEPVEVGSSCGYC